MTNIKKFADKARQDFEAFSSSFISLVDAVDAHECEDAPALSYLERTYTLHPEARRIFVSDSMGSDNNDGLSDLFPVKTISKGKSLLRDTKGDWMLLKRGDVWNERIGGWKISGVDATHPTIAGSYGDGARPIIDSGTSTAVSVHSGGGTPQILRSIAFVGLEMRSSGRGPDDTPSGFRWLRGTRGLTIDDCKIHGYQTNIVLQDYYEDDVVDVVMKNCVITDAYPGSRGHSQGLYAKGITNLTIENCILDKNGWQNADRSDATKYNQGLYIQTDCTGLIARNNIICRSGSHGLQARNGGLVENNFFYRNAIGLLMGYKESNKVTGVAQDNVFVEGTFINSGLLRGWGIEVRYPQQVNIFRNIVANLEDLESRNRRSIEDKANCSYSGNKIYNWPVASEGIGWGETLETNETFSDPDRNVIGYGFASRDDLYNALRLQSMDSYDNRLEAGKINNFYRDGFIVV